jgi:hypothetical protein
MEAETNNQSFFRRNGIIILIILLSSILIYYSVMLMLGPGRKLQAINEEFGFKSTGKNKGHEKMSGDSAYLRLLKEKAFLQSKLIMAESDSIYLIINIPDSIINIEISGVAVHNARMSSIKASSIFMKGDEQLILSMLSTPFTIANSLSTIRKEPVMIKMAPKDTSEFKPDVMPDTSLTEPVNYILEMTDGTRVFVYQEESTESKDRMNVFIFNLKYRLHEAWISLKDVCRFKVPEYHPFIKMKVPRSDAKIIYRAIPRYGQIAVYK